MGKNLWNDFIIEKFSFSEREAKIVYPNCKPNGKLILKTEYWDAFPEFEIEMVKRGYYLCNISHYTRWAPDEETHIMADFVKYVANKLNIEAKCVTVGMSCGGLQAARLAQLYPEMVSVMYLDAPVLNILSMAGLGACSCAQDFWNELVNTYRVDRSTIVNFRNSPIDHMDILIQNDIPVIIVYGNADTVVPYQENGQVLEDYYKAQNGKLKVIGKSACGHHPHSLEDVNPIIEFVEKYI